MRFVVQPPLFSMFTYSRILITAFVYALAILPTKMLLMLLPGAEVRFAACIPVLAGILWGPAGAIGSALGNFIGDFYSGDTLSICFWGAAANFFLAYLPYKLWYSFKTNATTHLFIHDTRSFLKFLGIIFITAFIFATMLTAIVETYGKASTTESFFIFFSNNFDFPLLLGIPVLLLLRRSNLKFVIPPAKQRSSRNYYIALLSTFILSAIYLLPVFMSSPAQTVAARNYLIATFFLLSYFCFIPAKYNAKYFDEHPRIFYSISAKATTGFLQMAILSVLFISFSAFILNPELLKISQSLDLWQKIFSTLLFSINIIFIAVLFILWQTEKNVVGPLINLSKSARKFANYQYLTEPPSPLTTPSIKKAADEIDDLTDSFNKMTNDIKCYVTDLSKAIKERENMSAQLKIAADIQQNILADTSKMNDKLNKQYDLLAGMYPAKEIGGDLYDCFFLDKEHLVILIADVSGKGIPAALFMMVTKALLKNNVSNSPGRILSKTNDTLCEGNDSLMFVTVWLGIVHLPSGKLTYANAGHNYPLLQVSEQEPHWLKHRSGPALGIKCGLTFTDCEIDLPHNSKLLLYTDGINEAENNSHEFFGMDRLVNRFQRTHRPEDILFAILEFSEGAEQNDDITFLWLERK